MTIFYVYETTKIDKQSRSAAVRFGVDHSGLGHIAGSKPVDLTFREMMGGIPIVLRPFYLIASGAFAAVSIIPFVSTLFMAMVGSLLKTITMREPTGEVFRQAFSAGVDAFEANFYIGNSILFQGVIKRAYEERPRSSQLEGRVTTSLGGVEKVDHGFDIEVDSEGAVSYKYRQNIPGPTLWILWGILCFVPFVQFLFIPLLTLQIFFSLIKIVSFKKIVLTDDVIMGEGRRLAIKDVRSIYIYNWIEKQVSDSDAFAAKMNSGVVYQAGSWAASAQASQQLSRMIGRLLFEKPFSAIAYRLCVDYGRKRIILARGLREDKAESLLAEVLAGLRQRGW